MSANRQEQWAALCGSTNFSLMRQPGRLRYDATFTAHQQADELQAAPPGVCAFPPKARPLPYTPQDLLIDLLSAYVLDLAEQSSWSALPQEKVLCMHAADDDLSCVHGWMPKRTYRSGTIGVASCSA